MPRRWRSVRTAASVVPRRSASWRSENPSRFIFSSWSFASAGDAPLAAPLPRPVALPLPLGLQELLELIEKPGIDAGPLGDGLDRRAQLQGMLDLEDPL